MIAVNVRKSAHGLKGEDDLRSSVAEGEWPLRSGVGLEEVARERVLCAVRSGRVVGAYEIEDHYLLPAPKGQRYDRVRFALGETPKAFEPLVRHRQLPEQLRWRRGESWPIRVVDTELVLDWLADNLPVPQPQALNIGPFVVELVGERHLRIEGPRSASITFESR